jgi:L-2,4-diaminobutyric acid acetyltransferase
MQPAVKKQEDHGLNAIDTTPVLAISNVAPAPAPGCSFRKPELSDGAAIQQLIQDAPPLDVNSTYAYLLLCLHFRDTCVVAEQNGQLAGFISAYVPPRHPDVLFVWQVAVHPSARGKRLGAAMLTELLARDAVAPVRVVETTVSPDNAASRRMFARLADDLHAPLEEQALFPPTLFGGADHDDERLLRIGPF